MPSWRGQLAIYFLAQSEVGRGEFRVCQRQQGFWVDGGCYCSLHSSNQGTGYFWLHGTITRLTLGFDRGLFLFFFSLMG
jgi:hypothetical protein